MDIKVPGVTLRDRRVAAADEFQTRDGRVIYRSHLRRGSATGDSRRPDARSGFDARSRDARTGLTASGRRDPGSITRIILHQMGISSSEDFPEASDPEDFRRDDHRLDVVIAHFVIRQNGVIGYTHDVETLLNGTAGLRDAIEIEFEGHYNHRRRDRPRGPRVPEAALRAGRLLVQALVYHPLLYIHSIHPHQQYSPSSRPNCPGPDIWVNVGEWAVNTLRLSTNAGRASRQISDYMSDQSYSIDMSPLASAATL
ncbi:MAG: N-acetylmuramoyl-L-alanine amidase [Gammaproteobacteria bacterium]|nr:N-acetylmuramoyl-L-alanine amidase [Gammaproteobacteria bacterium]